MTLRLISAKSHPLHRQSPGWRGWIVVCAAVLASCLALTHASTAVAQQPGSPEIGITERLGTTIGLDETLVDEDGHPVVLRDLVNLPTLLVFVYYRCPAICDPLLRELASNLDQLQTEAGVDYRVITISFDPTETAQVAKTKKAEILATMKRPPRADGWRFLTGEEAAVRPLTDAVGFKYKYEEQTQTYVNASSLIFLTGEGKIVRYIGGLEFLPAQLKLALHDAAQGRERSFMKSLERLCYSYDPKGRTYVLRINRLILALTGVFVLGFLAYLLLRKRPPTPEATNRE